MKRPLGLVTILFASVGAAVPMALLATAVVKDTVWWPKWILYVWPTSYMLGVNAGSQDATAYLIVAVSIAINAILYGYVGSVLFRVVSVVKKKRERPSTAGSA